MTFAAFDNLLVHFLWLVRVLQWVTDSLHTMCFTYFHNFVRDNKTGAGRDESIDLQGQAGK